MQDLRALTEHSAYERVELRPHIYLAAQGKYWTVHGVGCGRKILVALHTPK